MTVELNEPYNGYTTGELTGNVSGYRVEVRLTNGKLIWLYPSDYIETDD